MSASSVQNIPEPSPVPSPSLSAADNGDLAGKQGVRHEPESSHVSYTKEETAAVAIGEGDLPERPDPMSHTAENDLFHSVQLPSQSEPTDAPAYVEAAPEELVHPPDFQPFFTLIEDPETGEHHHPSVHYLFSDDDHDILTNATLAAIDQATAGSDEQDETEERVLVIDMEADGKVVAATTSFSSRWQALKVTVGEAPSWGEGVGNADRGAMLLISGQEATPLAHAKESKFKAPGMEELIRTFAERLSSLDEILGKEGEESNAQLERSKEVGNDA